MNESEKPDHVGKRERTARLRHVVDDCLRRRATGESVSDKSLIDTHPDLLPELAEELRKLRLIEAGGGKRSEGGRRLIEAGGGKRVDASSAMDSFTEEKTISEEVIDETAAVASAAPMDAPVTPEAEAVEA